MDAFKELVKKRFADAGIVQPDNLIRRDDALHASACVQIEGVSWALKVAISPATPEVERDERLAEMLYAELVSTDWECAAERFKGKPATAPRWRQCGVSSPVPHVCEGDACWAQYEGAPKVCEAFVVEHQRRYPEVAHSWYRVGRQEDIG